MTISDPKTITPRVRAGIDAAAKCFGIKTRLGLLVVLMLLPICSLLMWGAAYADIVFCFSLPVFIVMFGSFFTEKPTKSLYWLMWGIVILVAVQHAFVLGSVFNHCSSIEHELLCVIFSIVILSLLLWWCQKNREVIEDMRLVCLFGSLSFVLILMPSAGTVQSTFARSDFARVANISREKPAAAPGQSKMSIYRGFNEKVNEWVPADYITYILVSICHVYIGLAVAAAIAGIIFVRKDSTLLLGRGAFPNLSDLNAILMAGAGVISFFVSSFVFGEVRNSIQAMARNVNAVGGDYEVSSYFKTLITLMDVVPLLCIILGAALLIARTFKAEEIHIQFITYILVVMTLAGMALYVLLGFYTRKSVPASVMTALLLVETGCLLWRRKQWVSAVVTEWKEPAQKMLVRGSLTLAALISAAIVQAASIAPHKAAYILQVLDWRESFSTVEALREAPFGHNSGSSAWMYVTGAGSTLIAAAGIAAFVMLLTILLDMLNKYYWVQVEVARMQMQEEEAATLFGQPATTASGDGEPEKGAGA